MEVPRDDLERLRAERDELAEKVRMLEGGAKRDPKREQDIAQAIARRLPRAMSCNDTVVIIVSTMQNGDLCAVAQSDRRAIAFPQHRLSDGCFVLAAASLFASTFFVADVAASVPPRGRQ